MKWSEWLQQWFKTEKAGTQLIFLLGMGGLVLILLSEVWPAQSGGTEARSAPETVDFSYEMTLEQRLEALIGQVEGAGRTKVMVTLETGAQSVYAVDTREGAAESGQTHVLLDDGSALTETVRTPAVCGVAVVCEGGDQTHVVAQITEMLSSLLGISSSRISVAKMN